MSQHRDTRARPLSWYHRRRGGEQWEKESDYNLSVREICFRTLSMSALLGMTVGR